MIFLDTHVAVWLYEGDFQLIPVDVRRRIDREVLAISPYAQLELSFLHEAGKITVSAVDLLAELGPKLQLSVPDVSAAAVCRAARELGWTRDPFDRLIAAHATATGLPLVTKDRTIRRHLPLAWWGN